MIIKVSAFALVGIAMLCETLPVSIAAVRPMAMSSDSAARSAQEELITMRNQLQQANQRIEELERQLASGNLENAKRRIGELILQLHAKESEIAALRSSAYENSTKLREDLASQTEELNQAKRRIAEVEQQMAAGKGQELSQAKRRATEAEQQTARKDQELVQAKRRTAEAEQQLAGKEQELAQAKHRVTEAEQQTARKDQELLQAKRRTAEAEQQLAGKDQELAEAKHRVAEVEQQTAAGKGQELSQAKRRATEAEQQTARKDQELLQAKRRTAEAEQQLAGKEQELAQAKRRVAEVEQQTAAKDQELTQAKRRATEAEQQMAARKDQEPTQAKRRATETEQQTAGKNQELAQAKHRIAEVEQQMAGKDQELAQVKDDLKQATQKLAALNPQLVTKEAELARTKQLLADLERKTSKSTESTHPQEESLIEKNSLPPQSVEENLSATTPAPPSSSVAEDAEALLSDDLGKMSDSLANLLQPELKKGNVTLKQRGNKLTLAFATGELFTPGDATVTLGGASLLERVGTVLHGFRYQSIEVAGHTDNTPLRSDPRKGFRDNVELSQARAERTSHALVNGGLEPDRVTAVGYADTKPLAPNDTERGRSKNRRMEIVITQWSEQGVDPGDAKTHAGKQLRGFSTQTVTHH